MKPGATPKARDSAPPGPGGKRSGPAVERDPAASWAAAPPLPSWLFAVALIIVTFVAYWPALHGGFLWDDETHIEGNLNLRSVHGLWNIWFKPGDASSRYLQYYPLTFTIFWLEYHLWQFHTLGYHALNVLLHGTTAILLWQVLRRLKVPGAWLAGAIFALHPVCVMSVAWMTELKNVLSASLALGAAWAYLRADAEFQVSSIKFQEPRSGSGAKLDWRFYALSLVLFQLALFAKTAVSFLPVSLLLITWWRARGLNWRNIWPLLPMFGLSMLIGLLTVHVETHSGGASGESFHVSYLNRILISGRSFWFYLGKVLFPHQLTFFYERWQVNPGVWWQDIFPLLTVAVLLVLWALRGRIGRAPFAALAHFYVSTSFLILVVVLYMTRYTFVSDHWQYFGCMSIVALVAATVIAALDHFLGSNFPAKLAVCGVLLAGLGTLTWRQCGMYADIKTLWAVTLEHNPTCSVAHNDLGTLLLREAQASPPEKRSDLVSAATQHFKAVLAIDPDDSVANYNLGVTLKDEQPAEALEYLRRSLKSDPNDAKTEESLGNLLVQLGRFDEGLPHLQHAVALQPADSVKHYNLATALLQKGRVADAIPELKMDLELNPRDGMGHANYGSALMMNGENDQAIEEFKKAVSFMPKSAQAHTLLGEATLQKGELDAAVDEFQIALKAQPGFPLAKNRLLLIAWIWAAHPNDNFRSAPLAIRLAKDLEKEFGTKDPAVVAVTAAAYAELGNLTAATGFARDGVQLAMAQSNLVIAAKLREELDAFTNNRPYRDSTLTNLAPHP